MTKPKYPTTAGPSDPAGAGSFPDAGIMNILTGMQGQLSRLDERTSIHGRALDRMAQRFDAMDERLDQRFAAAEARSDRRFEAMEQRLGGMDTRMDGIDGRLDGIDGRLDGIDGRLDGIDGRLDGIDGRLDGIDGRLKGIDGKLESLLAWKHRVVGAGLAASVLGGIVSMLAGAALRLLGVSI